MMMTRKFWTFCKEKGWFLLVTSVLTTIIVVSFQVWNEPSLLAYEGKEVSRILEMMPQRDKRRLEHFFRDYINSESMGYVLFGNKPMALSGIDKELSYFRNFSSFLHAISPRRIQFENAFNTWKKYEKLFPMKRFVFLYEETDAAIYSLFINKKSFLQKIEQHADDFKQILKHDVTGEDLLKEGLHKPFLSEVLHDSDLLMGILFGFGRHNAELFHKRSQLDSQAERMNFCQNYQFGDPWEHELEELDAKWDKIGWLNAYITGNHLEDLELMMLPGFYADLNDLETFEIKEHFLQTKKKIINFYKDKDFLSATLQELTSD